MRQESVEFHIQQNDYFGTLATVLDLVRQDLDRNGYACDRVVLNCLDNPEYNKLTFSASRWAM